MIIVLPFPPSINHYYRHTRRGVFLGRAGRVFRENVYWKMKEKKVKPMGGYVKVIIDIYPPDNRKRDIDNILKALLDGLEHGGAYQDDNQIAKLVVTRHEPSSGNVVVEIRRYL